MELFDSKVGLEGMFGKRADTGWVEPGETEDDLVHADGRFTDIAAATAKEMERLMRDGQNKSDEARLCLGCVLTLLKLVCMEMVYRHPYSDASPSLLLTNLGDDLFTTGRRLKRHAKEVFSGDEHTTLKFILKED